MGKFDSKSFNEKAFKYAVERVPNLNLNEMIKSRALVRNSSIYNLLKSENGSAYGTIAMKGLLDGEAVNYDGETDITATSTKTFEQGVVAVGRAKGWIERDFSEDLTGVDFMDNVAQQVSDFFEKLDQDTLLAVLEGVFSMSGDTKSQEFVAKHTLDISGEASPVMSATTLNTAANKACGANKKKFSFVYMHSDVATGLENLNLIDRLKYTDPSGIQRDLSLGTWNGKVVLIDDAMPLVRTVTTAEVKGVYTITISTAATAGDKISVGGVEYTFGTATSFANKTIKVGTSSSTQASELKKVLEEQFAGVFSVSTSSNTTVLTQIVGGTGSAPAVTATQGDSGTIAASIATTTSGVAEVDENIYTTYALGEGSISFEDLGAKVPYEMDRNPAHNGGEDTLYVRQRKCFAPFGISYTKFSQVSNSPTDSELKMGANWELVHSGEESESDRTYINHKAIPICRIISKG